MLNETEKEINKDISCFSKLKLSNINKINKVFFHNKIIQYRNILKSEYENDNNFKEIVPAIQRQSKMNNIYKSIIKNGLKFNSHIMKVINMAIENIDNKKINKSGKEENKGKSMFNLPKIEMLKKQKEKYDKLKIKKLKLIKLNKENFEFKNISHINNISLNSLNESAKINKRPKLIFHNFSSITNNSTKNLENLKINFSRNKDLTLTPSNISKIEPSTNITYDFSKKTTKNNNIKKSFILTNNSKSYNIINKCNQEINQSNHKTKNINKIIKDFDKSINLKFKKDKSLVLDHKVIEEKNSSKNKYKKQERENMIDIKRKLEFKLSDHLAYENRKEYTQILQLKQTEPHYNLHLNEMNEINQKILERRKNEKRVINKINLMVNDEYSKSLEMNEKMDKINAKNKKIKRLYSSNKYIFPKDFFVTKYKNYGAKGNLIPSIINIRKNKMKNFGFHKRYLSYI